MKERGVGPAHDDRQHSVLPNVLLEHRTRPDDFHDALLRHRLPVRDPQTVAPLYAIRYGEQGLNLKEMADAKIPKGKMWLKTFYENPKGLFMGLYQKGGRIIANWLGWEYDYKPSLTHQAVYLKEEGRTVMLPADKNRGFINDLDDGMPFWPDGQTDDCLYMLRTVTRDARTGEAHRLAQAKETVRTAGQSESIRTGLCNDRRTIRIALPVTNRISASCYKAFAG